VRGTMSITSSSAWRTLALRSLPHPRASGASPTLLHRAEAGDRNERGFLKESPGGSRCRIRSRSSRRPTARRASSTCWLDSLGGARSGRRYRAVGPFRATT
jgi:hypothetical protein